MKANRTVGAFRQRGAGIVETMVGVLIGLIVVLVIYNVFALAEGYKRTAIGAGDAQVTGLFSQFVLAREIANGGNGIAGSMTDLLPCVNPALRPIPALITDGGAANVSDTVIVTYSTAPRVVWPVDFVSGPGYPSMAATTDPFYVQSPNGFKLNDRVIAIAGANCELTTVTNNPVPDVNGVVQITHPATGITYVDPAKLLNMGQVGQATRMRFSVLNAQLRSEDLFTAAAPNPVAQNVVLLKVQYGVDCLNNGVIQWTPATASNICGDPLPAVGTTIPINYTPADLQTPIAAPNDSIRLRRIRALRIGVVVRSDEPDLKLPMDPAVASATRAPVVLFNCSANTNAACQGRIVLPRGPVAAFGSDNCAPAIICDTWRYRAYETVVPLRNAIWN